MRPVTAPQTSQIKDMATKASIQELERASHEADITEMAQNFTFDASFTQTLALTVSSPTLANTNLVLATLLQMMQKGGLNRTT
jgi:hypothetical protein